MISPKTIFFIVWICLLCSVGQAENTTTPPLRVMFLGDSQSQSGLGEIIDSSLRERGIEVFSVVAGASTPYHWLDAYREMPSYNGYWQKTPIMEKERAHVSAVPKLEKMVEYFAPDCVVVQTGVNLYATLRSRRQTRAENVAEIENVMGELAEAINKAGAKPFWILPPHCHELRYHISMQKQMQDSLEKGVSGFEGSVFRSLDVTSYDHSFPQRDGVHLPKEDAQAWAEMILPVLTDYLDSLAPHQQPEQEMITKAIPSMIPHEPLLQREVADGESTTIAAAPIPSPPQPTELAATTSPQSGAQEIVMEIPISPQPIEIAAAAISPPEPEPESIAKPEAEPAKPEDAPPTTAQPSEEMSEAAPTEDTAAPAITIAQPVPTPEPPANLDLDLRLLAKSEVDKETITGEGNILAVFEYAVVKDKLGNYPYDRVRVAHGIVFGNRFTSAAKRPVGSTISLRLAPKANYHVLREWRLEDDLEPAEDMPIYTPRLD